MFGPKGLKIWGASSPDICLMFQNGVCQGQPVERVSDSRFRRSVQWSKSRASEVGTGCHCNRSLAWCNQQCKVWPSPLARSRVSSPYLALLPTMKWPGMYVWRRLESANSKASIDAGWLEGGNGDQEFLVGNRNLLLPPQQKCTAFV